MTETYNVGPIMASRLDGGPSEPAQEFVGQKRAYAPPPNRKRSYLILGLILAGILALAAYFMRLTPSRTGDTAVTATNITTTSATIIWSTDEALTSQVEYGTTPAYGFLSVFNSTPVTSHSVNLTSLTPGTTYNYSAMSTNSAGQVSRSPNFTFTTGGAVTAAGAAGSPSVSHIAAVDISTNSATITWITDQPLASQVEYGTTPAHGFLSVFSATPVTSHSVKLTALSPGTTYNYAVSSTNAAGQVNTSSNFTFTTSGTGNDTSGAGASVLSAVSASGITTNSAVITWTSDKPLTSQVEYGTTTAYGSLSVFKSSPVTAHSVNLTALTPGTTYNYAVMSTNTAGQITTSPNATFTTSGAGGTPVISSVTANGITTDSATINWTTDQPSASQLKYGTTASYGALSAYSSAMVTSHSVTVHGLTPGTTYNYAALSRNSADQVGVSPNFTLVTASGPPAIINVTVSHITGASVTITWTTDQPSSSQVKYGTRSIVRSLLRRPRIYESLSAHDASLVTNHSMVLNGLDPGTNYNFVVVSANSQGIEGTSPNFKFVTLAGKARLELRRPDSDLARAVGATMPVGAIFMGRGY